MSSGVDSSSSSSDEDAHARATVAFLLSVQRLEALSEARGDSDPQLRAGVALLDETLGALGKQMEQRERALAEGLEEVEKLRAGLREALQAVQRRRKPGDNSSSGQKSAARALGGYASDVSDVPSGRDMIGTFSVCILSPSATYFSGGRRDHLRVLYEAQVDLFDRALKPFAIETAYEPWDTFLERAAAFRKKFDLVLPCLAWGYHAESHKWEEVLERLEATGVPLVNSAATLRWNGDKRYLTEKLAERGVETVPTLVVERLEEKNLATATEEFERVLSGDAFRGILATPAVSAKGEGARLLQKEDRIPSSLLGFPTLLQPFLETMANARVLSLIFFNNGEYSHAVQTSTHGESQAGEAVADLQHTNLEGEVPPAALASARRALERCADGDDFFLYARVDLVAQPLSNGKSWWVAAVDLFEPQLFIGDDLGGGAAARSQLGLALVKALKAERDRRHSPKQSEQVS